jgi:hypothetical protein
MSTLGDYFVEAVAKMVTFTTRLRVEGTEVELVLDDEVRENSGIILEGTVLTFTPSGGIWLEVRPHDTSGTPFKILATPRYRHQSALRVLLTTLVVNVLEPYPGTAPSRALLRRKLKSRWQEGAKCIW